MCKESVFHLCYLSLKVGILSLSKGIWTFQYADEFKKQDTIKPLPDFPDINKIYTNEELYPFFVQRIPGLGQPKVQEIIEKEDIDETSEVELLKRFGRHSIANPFELLAV